MSEKPRRDLHERRLLRAGLIGAACALVLFLGILVQDGGLLHRDAFGNFYAAQADALNHGHWDVKPGEVGFEGFEINGKVYLYFGPVPAIVRMPVEAVTSRFHGRLTRLSMLIAEAVLLAFVIRLVEIARRATRPQAPAGRLDALFTGLFVFAAGASSTLYLAGQSWVYHEALIWGSALTIGSLTMLAAFLQSRRLGRLAWSGVLAVLAFNTRSATGAGALVALGLVGLVELRRLVRSSDRARPAWMPTVVIGGSLLVAVGCYVVVNWVRFGSLTGLPLDKQILAHYDVQRQRILAANHNSMFGAKFVPTQLFQAMRPDAIHPTRLFPFVNFPEHAPRVLGSAVMDTTEPTSSVTASEPALAVMAIMGVVGMLWGKFRRRLPGLEGWGLLTFGAACSALGFIAISFVSNRYLTDALPFLLISGTVGLQCLLSGLRRMQPKAFGTAVKPIAACVAVGLVSYGAWVNASLGVQYHEVTAPGASVTSKAEWLRLQMRIDRTLHGDAPLPGIVRVQRLPATTTRGELAVVGRCQALYRSYGTDWSLLDGGQEVIVNISGKLASQPGRPQVVAEKRQGNGQYQIVLRSLPHGKARVDLELVGPNGTTTVQQGEVIGNSSHGLGAVEVTMDPFMGYVRVMQKDRFLLGAAAPVSDAPITAVPGLHIRSSDRSLCLEVAAKAG